ncbi:hypothetical protein SAMD00019534_061610 [Acytostelium subglobosum LB1]|uniref:hypothetical protein n=1 Tax=Acytostelium subglobosum LB1 TaxID=1410327 RepID=UPI000644D39F|nr:hypothetical protein SAMD00019534_061610 [Acytostelium subglobosum LB1]GAM22986.1 hypothetical protein SAMD00019534_061610 [Acytostelium subglobosum LB1]|eukprot:XP_012754213.1 hypothetical protein SAMD00019534_061610 [Acytostelium subglobosum LB1]
MKNNTLFVVLVILTTVAGVLAVPVKWATNGHFYEIASAGSRPSSWTYALAWAASYRPANIPANYVGYIGTITSLQEYTFISSLSGATSSNWYTSVLRFTMNEWGFSSGPEKDTILYDSMRVRCNSFCLFNVDKPDSLQANNINFDQASKTFVNTWYDTTTSITLFLVEWGPANEPYVAPVSTAGGVTSVALTGYNTANLVVTLTPSGGSAVSVPVVSTTATSATIRLPTGGGVNTLTITDGTNTYTNTIYKYLTPWINMFYPVMNSGGLITVTGNNFGNVAANLKIQLGSTPQTCGQVTLLADHTQATCSLPFTPSPTATLFPVVIQQSTSEIFSTYSATIYDKYNMRGIAFHPSQNSYYQSYLFITGTNPPYYLDNYRHYGGIPSSATQIAMVKNVYPFSKIAFDYHVAAAGTGTGAQMASWGGPFDNTTIVTSSRVCDASKLVACPNGYAGALSSGQTSYFQYRDDIYGISGDNDDGWHGNIIMYGINPTISDTGFKFVNTSGGAVNITMPIGMGFTFTTRTIALNGITVPYTLTPFFADNKLQITVPAGTGVPKSANFFFENIKVGGPSFGYNIPYAESISSPGTQGDTVIIRGYNFGSNASLISVKINSNTCSNVAIVLAHYTISCTVQPGAGSGYPVIVTVDSLVQTNNLQMSYAAPLVTGSQHNGAKLTLFGNNFGGPLSGVFVNIPDKIQADSSVFNGSVYIMDITLPIIARNGPVYLTVSGVSANRWDVNYTPSLVSLAPLVSANGGDLIKLTGNFLNTIRQGGDNTDMVIALGGNNCTSPYFSSDAQYTYLQCVSPKGTGKGLSAQVTIDGVASNVLNTFAYLPPNVTNFMQNGMVATIAGDNFGEDFSVITVTYNTDLPVAATSMHLMRNSIVVPIPGSTTNGELVVRVNGQDSTPFVFKVAPVITAVNTIPTIGGDVVITGHFFNPTDFYGQTLARSVFIHGIECQTSRISAPNTEIICEGPAGTGANNALTVTIDGVSGAFTFAYMAPTITNVATTETSFIVTGTNLGSDETVIFASIETDGGIVNVTASAVTNDVAQVVTIPSVPETTLNGQLMLTVNHQTSNGLSYVIVPIITSTTQSPTMGGSVVITGSHLTGRRANSDNTTVSVTVAGQPCTNAEVSQFTSLTCNAPAGTGLSNELIVSIDGTPSRSISLAYLPPNIVSVVQNEMTVTITGTNLGSNTAVASITYGTSQANANEATDTSLVGPIPNQAKSGKVFVKIDSQTSNELDMTLIPILKGIGSTSTAGGQIEIQGYFLNGDRQNGTQTDIQVSFGFASGAQPCTQAQYSRSDSQYTYISCKAPAGTGSKVTVTVTIDGQSDTIPFSYDAPTLTSIDVSTSNMITLTGTNFGSSSSDVVITYGDNPVATFTLVDDTHIRFQAPADAVNALVTVSIQERTSNGLRANLFPMISVVTGSDTQGTSVTITGSYLNRFSYGSRATEVIVQVDSANCTSVSWPSDNTQLVCTAPRGTGFVHKIGVSIDGRASNQINFKYNLPTIINITQNVDVITISGTNFGTNSALVSLSNGYAISQITDYTIVATLATNALNNYFNVSVDSQISNQFLLQIQPVITNTLGVSPYGGNVFIQGRYLNDRTGYGTPTTIVITIGGQPCTYKSTQGNSQIICELDQGSFNSVTVNVTIESKTGQGLYSSLAPAILSSTKLWYQVVGNITITGSYFYAPISVAVSGLDCIYPVLVNSTTITCQYDATYLIPNNGLQNITVTSASLKNASPVFSYLEEACDNNCTGNGECISGLCRCFAGFSGSLCNVKYDATVIPTTTRRTAVFMSNSTFGMYLEGVKEVTPQGTTVKSFNINNVTMTWTNVVSLDNNNVTQVVSLAVANDGSSFSVEIDSLQYKVDNFVQFVGQNVSNIANSIKHQVRLTNWTFANAANTLQVIYRITYLEYETYECKNSSIAPAFVMNNITGSLKTFTIDTPYGVFVGSFSNRHIADKVNKLLNVQQVPADESFPAIDGLGSVLVALNIPSFTKQAYYDPTFISYSKANIPDSDCDTHSSGKSRSWVLPVAIVLSIVGAALIGLAGYLVYRRRQRSIKP